MRRNILAAGIAVAVVATGLVATGVAVTARSASAALSDVPADCRTRNAAYRTDGQALTYRYADKKTSTEAMPGDKLGWVPTGIVTFLESGSDGGRMNHSLATHPTDGTIYHIKRATDTIDGVEKVITHTVTPVKTGFGGTRFITMAYPFLYRAAGTSLYRYKLSFVDGKLILSGRATISSTAWDTVKTLNHQRTVGTGANAVDVLFGTKSNGQLKEWRINYATPAVISSKVLKETGWGSFTSLGRGSCNSRPNGRALMGVTAEGRASVYFDANEKDGLGTDIKGGSLGLVGWTEKAY
ncbi:hypothetical protein E1263_36720 [Kribbella antibiotica]|uniref:Tat pathway signal sequence domain protein n=1 Tax=Kribbella antibiotica TaxID=190195 RepID=A0A4R4YMW0_9ACTN|nr:hypothetical protein [Kribbella antibiotica]TDD46398.1 hypothetical protein E1263_36720 [Kribbella antibiotica]